MKPLAIALGLAVLAASPMAQAAGGGVLESYVARLSAQDHFNSQGVRLTTAAGIIRQDRANYHVYGQRDPEDEDDSFFASRANRARLEALLLAGRSDPGAIREVVNGQPLVRVDVYRRSVRVEILD